MSLLKKTFPSLPEISDFFDGDWREFKLNGDKLFPAVNVIENDGDFEIEVAAPGFKKEDFKVEVENGVLTITGKTEKEEKEKKKNYTRKEFSSKSFQKSFTLPENVEKDEVAAKYKDGLLRLTLKKTEKSTAPKKEVVVE